ncbi:MAG: hypothetical protein FWH32_00675 [Clostridiales bacterium]|nr:hypothetical protein [Clostridiales bacterium]
MKKKLMLVLAVVVAFTMVFAACGSPAPAPEPAPAPAPAPAAPAPEDPTDDRTFDWDISVTLGEPVSPSWARLFEQLRDESGGRINPTVFWSGSLLPIPEIPRGMASGAAAFSNLPTPNYPDALPLTCRIMQLPFLGLEEPLDSAQIYMQLLSEFPEMVEELASFNMVAIGATPLGVYDMHFTDKNPVHLPEDLRGRQMVPYNVVFLPLLEANGVGVNYIAPGEIFEALNNNVVDGYINNWAFKGWFGLTDLINQSVAFGPYGMYTEFNVLVVNKDMFEDMPADLQQLVRDTFWNNGGYRDMWGDTMDIVVNQRAIAEDKGNLITVLTDDEVAVWREALLPQHRVVLDEINAQRGDDVADRIYNRLLEILGR